MIIAQSEFVCIKKLKKIIKKPFLVDYFTPSEIEYCNNYKDKDIRLAGTLAAKIAFIKAASDSGLLPVKKIEVRHRKNGRPFIVTDSKILKDYSISVSISHTKSIAVAYCVITKNGKISSS